MSRGQRGSHVRVEQADGDGYLAVVYIDAAGSVTAIYPENGTALPVTGQRGMTYLPDALEFTGHGDERLFFLLTAGPMTVDMVKAAAQTTYARSDGDLRRASSLGFPATVAEYTWLIRKP